LGDFVDARTRDSPARFGDAERRRLRSKSEDIGVRIVNTWYRGPYTPEKGLEAPLSGAVSLFGAHVRAWFGPLILPHSVRGQAFQCYRHPPAGRTRLSTLSLSMGSVTFATSRPERSKPAGCRFLITLPAAGSTSGRDSPMFHANAGDRVLRDVQTLESRGLAQPTPCGGSCEARASER